MASGRGWNVYVYIYICQLHNGKKVTHFDIIGKKVTELVFITQYGRT